MCLFLVNDIAWAQPSPSVIARPAKQAEAIFNTPTLAPELRLKPFSDAHGLAFRNILTAAYVAREIRDPAVNGKLRESHIAAFNRQFPKGEIKIHREIETGSLGSGKKYACVFFEFTQEKKQINVLLLKDYANLTPEDREELKKFGIKNDTDISHLAHPGLEGVWFINPVATSSTNDTATVQYESKVSRSDAFPQDAQNVTLYFSVNAKQIIRRVYFYGIESYINSLLAKINLTIPKFKCNKPITNDKVKFVYKLADIIGPKLKIMGMAEESDELSTLYYMMNRLAKSIRQHISSTEELPNDNKENRQKHIDDLTNILEDVIRAREILEHIIQDEHMDQGETFTIRLPLAQLSAGDVKKSKGSCADCLNSITGNDALMEKAMAEGLDIETDLKQVRLRLRNPDQPFSDTTIYDREINTLVDLGILIRLPDGKIKFSDMMTKPDNKGPPDKEYTKNLIRQIIEIEYRIGKQGEAKNKPFHRGEIPLEVRPKIKELVVKIAQQTATSSSPIPASSFSKTRDFYLVGDAQAALRRDDVENAIKKTEEAARINPDNHYAWTILAQAYLKRRVFPKAIAALSPDQGRSLKPLLARNAVAHTTLANILDHAGNTEYAIGILSDDEGRSLKPLLARDAVAHNTLANILNHAGNTEYAIGILSDDEGGSLKPLLARNAVAYNILCHILISTNLISTARSLIDRMLVAFTYDPGIHIASFYIYLEMKDTKKASEVLRNARLLFPKEPRLDALYINPADKIAPTAITIPKENMAQLASSDMAEVTTSPLLIPPISVIKDRGNIVDIRKKSNVVRSPQEKIGRSIEDLRKAYLAGDELALAKRPEIKKLVVAIAQPSVGAAAAQDVMAKASGDTAARKEAARIHEANLKPEYMPAIPEKTILCHVIPDSILPDEQQRQMVQLMDQYMRDKDKNYIERIVHLKVSDSSNFIEELKTVMGREITNNQGYSVQFCIACPDTATVGRVLEVDSRLKALAFDSRGKVVQVEGIMLALRALYSNDIENLKIAFEFLAGDQKRLSPEELSITDINEFVRRVIFILPSAKELSINNIGDLNKLIRKNIEAAA